MSVNRRVTTSVYPITFYIWRDPVVTAGAMIYTILRALCIIVGAFLLLKALWLLRIGENERRFLLYGIIGVIVITLPWWGISFYLFSIHPVITNH